MIDLEVTRTASRSSRVNAPATRNALNNELAAQFVAACDVADRDPCGRRRRTGGRAARSAPGAERGHLDEVGQ